MSHKCFISFKKEDAAYKDEIVKKLRREDVIVKSLDRWIDSESVRIILVTLQLQFLLLESIPQNWKAKMS